MYERQADEEYNKENDKIDKKNFKKYIELSKFNLKFDFFNRIIV